MTTPSFWNTTLAYSQQERQWVREMEDLLTAEGFQYLSIPSLVSMDTIATQEAIPVDRTLKIQTPQGTFALAGSAEQGILETYRKRYVKVIPPVRVFANNQCFRNEDKFIEGIRLPEFRKVEMFSMSPTQAIALKEFADMLRIAKSFLEGKGRNVYAVDVTSDPGYHIKKTDLLMEVPSLGAFIEVCSCTYFGTEQSERFHICDSEGDRIHTVSCTGLATPRALLT